ncbi:tandem-95 repeat protein [Christiangramia sp. LLG6405-1]|uniref:tandem-95 repeat protein n=1 Tax=Christiangramia sp. LLG6405-1 TaxID=3160832 RepID=UPI00386F9496
MKHFYVYNNISEKLNSYVLLFFFGLLCAGSMQAQVREEFVPRVSENSDNKKIYNVNGDFTLIGNSNLTLQNYSENGLNSNSTMVFVNKDGNEETYNSSSAELTFSTENGASSECSNVVYAGLYWTGRANALVTTNEKRSIKFRTPNGNYQEIIAAQNEIRYPGDNGMYVGYSEVTDLVKNSGAGEYWVADIALSEGNGGSTGYYGGWGMVVVYENALMNPRDVTIFDGYAYVRGNATEDYEIDVEGFNTAQYGDINIKLGLMAGEGDRGISGDYFEIKKRNNQWQRLSHDQNSTGNFFNSSINTDGDRNPDLVNNTGLDISMFNVPNQNNSVIGNNQSEATFRYGTTQDTYIIYSLAMSVDAYQPKIEGINSIESINGQPYTGSESVQPGDEITYKIELRNKGSEDLENVKLVIPLPYNGSYVENSAQSEIFYSPTPTPNSISFNNTLGATGSVVWNLGDLPTTADNSTVLAEITLKIKVTEDCDILKFLNCSSGASLDFKGSLNGKGKISGVNFENTDFIQGFDQSGACDGQPITRPLTIPIDAQSYIEENCSDSSDRKKFKFCESLTNIPVSEIRNAFPSGTRFYDSFPIDANTIEYTTNNPFPVQNDMYYAIVPGTNDCFIPFDIEVESIDISIESISATCDQENGKVSILNFNLNYNYTLLDEDGQSIQQSINSAGMFTNLSPGTYSVRVDKGSCNKTSEEITIANSSSRPDAPTGESSQNFCETSSSKVSDLVAVGNNIKWYADENATTTLDLELELIDGEDYYASQNNGSCESESRLKVTVSFDDAPDAGTNGTLTLCEGTTPTNEQLFAALQGQPDTNGTWTADGNSYTYTVEANGTCTVDATATVTVSFDDAPDAGTDGTLTLCEGATPTNEQLFAALQGTPDTNGTFQVTSDNVYTYTVTAQGECSENATATVTVSFDDAPDAGINGTLTLCEGATPTNEQLFAALQGEPDTNGTFQETSDNVFTYTVTAQGKCSENATATVTVYYDDAPDAGTDGTLTLCEGATPTNEQLFAALQGTPDTNGTFQKTSDNVYTYTVTAQGECSENATATVTVSFDDAPDAGTDGTLTLCEGATPTNEQLFAALQGTPDTNGTFQETSDNVFTYTVTAQGKCSENATATVTVYYDDAPDAGTDGTLTLCEGATPTNEQLFAALQGTPDTNGTFQVTSDNVYTYTVTAQGECSENATATVTVSFDEAPVADSSENIERCDSYTLPVLSNGKYFAEEDGINPIAEGTVITASRIIFIYTEGNETCNAAQNSFKITINKGATANNDSASTIEDNSITISVLSNDENPEESELGIVSFTQSSNGTVTQNENNTFTYIPNENYNGTDTFEYTITNGSCSNSTATVTVTVTPVNDGILAVDDSATTAEDTAVSIDVLDNDSDPDGDTISINDFTQPANGTVTLVDGELVYTPNTDFTGTDTFEYTITDGDQTDTATVTVTVTPVNDAPVALDDDASTSEDTPIEIAVLNNDSDPDNDPLSVTETTQPENGTVVINNDGTVTYTPNENFNGEDTFEYTISDGNGGTDTATVTVTVAPVNDAPVAVDDSASTSEDTPIEIAVLNNDSDPDNDPLSVTETTQPENGTVVINNDGTVTYTPNENFNGGDTFEYTISDGNGGTDTATVTITIGAENDAPIAVDDSASTSEDTPVEITVLNNDSDPDNDPLSVTETTQPENGTVVINIDGTVTYTPNENFNGEDTFTYTITDGDQTDTATVTVTVTPVNDGPVAVNDAATTDQDTAVTVSVLDNDFDIDGGDLVVTETTTPENGMVVINSDGTVTYTPNDSFTGVDTFEYTISDGNGGTDTAVVTITVNDTEGPQIVCPQNLILENDPGVCGAIVDFTIPEFTDNAEGATIVQTSGPASGEIFPVGTTTVSFSATDVAGNTSFCSFDVIVTDTEAPVVEEMEDITVNNDAGVCGAVVDFGIIGATDNCELESVEVTEGLTSGSEFPVGTTTVTYTVTDVAGNTATESFTVTVNDNEAPEISCPANMTIDTETGVSYATVDFENATATDNCEVTVEQNGGPVSGSQFEIGTTTITFTATDAAGNTSECSFTVTVEDNEDPTIVCPETINQDNDPGLCGAAVSFTLPEISDNSGDVSLVQTAGPASGETFPVGTTTVSFTATDAAGNTSFCSFDVIVTDSEAPVVEEMEDITVNNDAGVCGAVVDFGIIGATDNCELESVEVTEGLTSGSEFPVGTTTVTYTVTDVAGNTTTESFTVTVNDNEAPEISCPANMTIDTETGVSYAIVDFENATATDNCEVTVKQTGGPVSGSKFEIGTTIVTFTATDAAGNTSECSFTVTVEDNEDPTIVCQDDIEISNNKDMCGAVVEFNTPQASDNSEDFTVAQTAGLASGETFPVGTTTVTFTVTDAAGNTSECSFDIIVTDDQAPELEALENITVNNDAGICGAIVTYEAPTATDNCELAEVTLTDGMESGSEFPIGTTTVTYTATDNAGNTSNSSFTVTVIDNEAPLIDCPENITVTVGFGMESRAVDYNMAETSDNCSGESVTMISGIASGGEFPLGVTTITFEATDASGNTSECSFTVTVVEENAPAPPAAPEVDVVQPSCSEPTGTIMVDVQNGLTYSIDGETYQANGVFTNLSPGTYDVVAQDEFGQLSDLTTVVLAEPVAEDIVLIDNGIIDLCVDDSTFNLFDLIADNDDNGNWIDTDNTGALDNGFITPGLMDLGTYTFELQIDGNCLQSTFVTVIINDDCVVLDCSVQDVRDSISKAVTPNGDNINDFFTINPDIACGFTYDLMIFNRWGAKVFDAKNYQNNWDGFSDSSFTSSNQLPSGTYYYVLKIREGNFEPIQGYIYLGTK